MEKRFVITNWFGQFLCKKNKVLYWGNETYEMLTFPSAAEAIEIIETNEKFCKYGGEKLTHKDLPELLDAAMHVDGFVEVNICELKFEKRYTRRWEI